MNKDIIIKKSKISKKGVFAARDFSKDEVILRWNPIILEKSEVGKLKDSDKHFVVKVNEDKYFLMQAPEKFVNHSCEPNTQVKNNCDVAIRDIKKGEEITSDYEKNGIVPFKCTCKSKNCRGVIN